MMRQPRGRKRMPGTLPALLIAPLVVVGIALSAAAGSHERLPGIRAAVVNRDKPVTIAGQITPLGRQLAAAVTERKDANITWVSTHPQEAEDGLKDGRYAAVVDIPEDFSAAATSIAGKDSATVRQARVDVRTGHAGSLGDAAVAQRIASAAADTVNAMVTGTYLDKIYVGFNEMGSRFDTVATAAGTLADGSGRLADGVGKASHGAGQLADGLSVLRGHSPKLADGAGALDRGLQQLQGNSGALTGGAERLKHGGGLLAQGTTVLNTRVTEFTVPVRDGAESALRIAAKYREIEPKIDEFVDGPTGVPPLPSLPTMPPADAGDQGPTLAELRAGLRTADRALDRAKSGALSIPSGRLDDFASTCHAAEVSETACVKLAAAAADAYRSGAADTAAAAGSSEGLAAAMAAAERLRTPTATAATGDRGAIEDYVKNLIARIEATKMDVRKLRDVLKAEMTNTEVNATKAIAGAGALEAGAQQLDAGARTLGTGLGVFSDGVHRYADGVDQAAGGAGRVSDGVRRYTGGVDQAAGGAGMLSNGLKEASSGAARLEAGSDLFAGRLAEGRKQLPHFDDAQRKALSTAAARPVVMNGDRTSQWSLLPVIILVLSLSAWFGALATFTVIRPIPRDVLTDATPTGRVWWRTVRIGLVVGVAQAVITSVVAGMVAHLDVATTAALAGVMLLVSVMSVTVNHALAAAAPVLGRTLSLACLATAGALGVMSTAPETLAAIHVLSPLRPIVTAVTAVTVDAPDLAVWVAALVVWTIGGFGAGWAAIHRRRGLGVTTLWRDHIGAAVRPQVRRVTPAGTP